MFLVAPTSTPLTSGESVMLSQFASGSFLGRRGGGLGEIISWFIRVVIYDICVTSISEILGVPRIVALFIFLGILAAIALGGYLLKQKYASGVED